MKPFGSVGHQVVFTIDSVFSSTENIHTAGIICEAQFLRTIKFPI